MKQNHEEIMQYMGSMATDSEADALEEICAERGIEDLDEVDNDVFFTELIPMAVHQANQKAR